MKEENETLKLKIRKKNFSFKKLQKNDLNVLMKY